MNDPILSENKNPKIRQLAPPTDLHCEVSPDSPHREIVGGVQRPIKCPLDGLPGSFFTLQEQLGYGHSRLFGQPGDSLCFWTHKRSSPFTERWQYVGHFRLSGEWFWCHAGADFRLLLTDLSPIIAASNLSELASEPYRRMAAKHAAEQAALKSAAS